MAIVDRVRNICVDPGREWPVIEREATEPAGIVAGYLAPLAALGAVAGFIGGTLIGVGPVRRTLAGGLVGACITFVLTLASCFLVGWIINALAPTFGGRQDSRQAFKVAAYSYTPGLVAGVLAVLPILSGLARVVAAFYTLYLLYLGLPVLMKAPPEKAIAYTAVVVISTIAVMVIVGGVLALFGVVGTVFAG